MQGQISSSPAGTTSPASAAAGRGTSASPSFPAAVSFPAPPDSELEAEILAFVARVDFVSFPELVRRLEERFGRSLHGDCNLALEARPRDILWAGLSEDILEALVALHRARRIFFHPAAVLVYLIDGEVLRPRKPFRWLPVTLRTVPLPTRAAVSRRRATG